MVFLYWLDILLVSPPPPSERSRRRMIKRRSAGGLRYMHCQSCEASRRQLYYAHTININHPAPKEIWRCLRYSFLEHVPAWFALSDERDRARWNTIFVLFFCFGFLKLPVANCVLKLWDNVKVIVTMTFTLMWPMNCLRFRIFVNVWKHTLQIWIS